MPRVILSVSDYDPLCPVDIDALPTTTAGDLTRRVSRSATLDGGAAIDDGGFSEADRTIEVFWATGTDAAEERVRRLVRLYPRVTCAFEAGLYLCAPQRYAASDGTSRLTLLVDRKLNA